MRLHTLPGGKTAARYPAGVYHWRAIVQQAVAGCEHEPFVGPVEVRLGFDLTRPQGHFGTGKNSTRLKPSAPIWPGVMPDIDKLSRAVLDSITDAGLWKDDAQVVVLYAAKRYALERAPGVLITIIELTA
jgi:Holliday junction resolvase RusA-like endonuclease